MYKLPENSRKTLQVLSSLVLVAVLFLMPAVSSAADFTKYHNYDEFTAELKKLVNAHSNIANIISIGKTLEGRDIWAVEIANPNGVPVKERPAIFIGANFEGDHVVGSELALYTINYLLTNYDSNADVKNRIDNHVMYIVPRVNPDGAERMFAGLKTGQKTNTKPHDDDNDGRIDEDGPEDLNNDNQITVMRVKDRKGKYMIDPSDPRLLKLADPKKGEVGEYLVYWEGLDNDNDGFFNEDGPGGIDINRNFQHNYPYYKRGAGKHMVSELESRAVMDYVLARRNIAVILTYGESDNLFTPPNAKGDLSSGKALNLLSFAEAGNDGYNTVGIFRTRPTFGGFGGFGQQQSQSNRRPRRPALMPQTKFNRADIDYFKAVSDKYKDITGLKALPHTRKAEGSFFEFGYFQYGVPSFSTPGWDLTSAEINQNGSNGSNGPNGNTARRQVAQRRPGGGSGDASFDKTLLEWMTKEGVDGFVDWQTFDHPTLGEVEIGGFKPYSTTNPPAGKIADLGDSHSEFVLYLTSIFPKIEIAHTEVVDHGSGIYRIKAEIQNNGFLPTSLAHGRVSGAVRATLVQLGVKPDDIISGNSKTNFFRELAGSGKIQEYEWIIKGRPGQKVELRVVSQKSGSAKKTVELK